MSKAGTLRLPLGGQSGDASLTPGRAKRGRFAYFWEDKAGTLRLLLEGKAGRLATANRNAWTTIDSVPQGRRGNRFHRNVDKLRIRRVVPFVKVSRECRLS